MQTISGSTAFSDFRIAKTLAGLQQVCPQVTGLHAEYSHFLDVETELTGTRLEQARQLLDYGYLPQQDVAASKTLLVIPRPGTISPWASKATDIFHACGLSMVKCVERGVCWHLCGDLAALTQQHYQALAALLHDRMTQTVLDDTATAVCLFQHSAARPLNSIALSEQGIAALEQANSDLGLALSADEMDYLFHACSGMGRDPTDVEVMMFAQANSEHCRHKIFNARWDIDGKAMQHSLFDLIKQTHQANPGRVLSAYKDNAAVISAYQASRFFPDPATQVYGYRQEAVNMLMKVETHNHPTAISPYPGAATGAGGEIRDDAATCTGAKPKAGLCGFAVSNLNLPELPQPWERPSAAPAHIASALQIMLEGPIGAAAYNNEFGRPVLSGYFRCFEEQVGEQVRGYHKPIMIAGGYGVIRDEHIHKQTIAADSPIVVLGGPAMLIGLGGGAASSMGAGSGDQELDFASVQRDNAEIERRCQEVINQCWALGEHNPVLSIHDVGAGGLSNALPELVDAAARGAVFDLSRIPCADPAMSPMELWCNESQERYVLAIGNDKLQLFSELCRRERAPFAVIGHATGERQLIVHDSDRQQQVVDMPLSVLLGKPPGLSKTGRSRDRSVTPLHGDGLDLTESLTRLLQLPTIADKRFLITIGDRSVSGLVCRDQMVGPWQTPVADCAITGSGYDSNTGEAMALGERAPLAVSNPAASGRMALAEAISNICASRILRLDDIALSANWMAACGEAEEDKDLFDTVSALSACARELGLAIPVGKDSLSMHTRWQEQGVEHQVSAPLSVIVTAFAPVADIHKSLTPQLVIGEADSVLLLIDLGCGQDRLGESALAQVYNRHSHCTPDIDDSALLRAFFNGIQLLNETGHILAYHDRSDGGLLISLCEMAFAGRQGIDVGLQGATDPVAFLFNEEAGAVIQIRQDDLPVVTEALINAGLPEACLHTVARLNPHHSLRVFNDDELLLDKPLAELHGLWSRTSFLMQSLRDNPDCAAEEYAALQDISDPGLSLTLPFTPAPAPAVIGKARPKLGILREQGVNGQVEMAAAFTRAGFDCIDIHSSDLQQGRQSLTRLQGLAACGGFSYGDVLGAGGGWAKSILFNPVLREQFEAFFQRPDSFGLGVCNGCQMMSQLTELIPGAAHWPQFVRNRSEQYEARLVMVEIMPSPSLFFHAMQGAKLPIAVAHGEGRVQFAADQQPDHAVLRYIDNSGAVADRYPANPNGSGAGLTGFTTDDGRFTIMMPHPERVFLRRQFSWIGPDQQTEDSPWMQMFYNARHWLD
ncbi:MAG: phosphoribosylformylglycinamidine synthase [Gammaproteobacteria bacterium]